MPLTVNPTQYEWDTGSPMLNSMLESVFPQDPASSAMNLAGPLNFGVGMFSKASDPWMVSSLKRLVPALAKRLEESPAMYYLARTAPDPARWGNQIPKWHFTNVNQITSPEYAGRVREAAARLRPLLEHPEQDWSQILLTTEKRPMHQIRGTLAHEGAHAAVVKQIEPQLWSQLGEAYNTNQSALEAFENGVARIADKLPPDYRGSVNKLNMQMNTKMAQFQQGLRGPITPSERLLYYSSLSNETTAYVYEWGTRMDQLARRSRGKWDPSMLAPDEKVVYNFYADRVKPVVELGESIFDAFSK